MGRLLRAVYELQLDGKVTTLEEALQAARDLLERSGTPRGGPRSETSGNLLTDQ
jgi:hypothetical protein